MNTFSTIAAVCGPQVGVGAKTVANIEVYVNYSDQSPSTVMNAPLILERFGTNSPLFRIVALNANASRNNMVLCLPTSCLWQVSQLRKIKSKTSGKKAIQFDVLALAGNKEGYDKLAITIPFDGDDGMAVLYYQAVVFASQEVLGYWLQQEQV
jgi:hypothetical protein